MKAIECIRSSQVQRLLQFRIKPEADLLSAISEAIQSEGIRTGVLVSGLGALKRAVFRNLKHFPNSYPVTPEDRLYLEIAAPMELVSLGGWIAPRLGDAGMEIHAHFAASTVENDRVVTLGGHLTEGTICGIKVVVAILAIDESGIYAADDPASKTRDIFFRS